MNDIELGFTGESFEIEGRGVVYVYELIQPERILTSLLRAELLQREGILGVETFAIKQITQGMNIGLLKKK